MVSEDEERDSNGHSEASKLDDKTKLIKTQQQLQQQQQQHNQQKVHQNGLQGQQRFRSKNPFKKLFGRSKSHQIYAPVASPAIGSPGSSLLKQATEAPMVQGGTRSRGASFNNRSSTGLPSMAMHNSNPFANGSRKPNVESPFSVLGTGTDVASPRNAGPSTRNTSHNFAGSSICTPTITAQSSRSISYYQTEGNCKQEKLLPLPVRSPNDQLPPYLQQPSVLLTDNFSFYSSPEGEKRIIGEGGSSQVVSIVSNYRRSHVYALKRFKMFGYEEPDEFYNRCIREYLLAKKLDNHVNIIKTFYIMKVPSSATVGVKRSWAFIMQQCVQDVYYFTTLSGWANKTLEEKWCCFKQIARGLKHMHSLGIAHRDLKLENVLATDYSALKLTDFGVSTYGIKDPDDPTSPRIKLRGFCGSPPHVSPEVMILSSEKRRKNEVPEDKLEYDPFAMDMWALGMVLYTLVIPNPPFAEAHKDDSRYRHFVFFYEQFCRCSPNFKKPNTYKQGPGAEHPEFSKFQSTDATRVCLRLLDPDPNTRYTMEDLFNDPWFQQIETCVDEGLDEPVKLPELRKTTEGSDSPYAHDISPSDEENSLSIAASHPHTSNPFLCHNGVDSASLSTTGTRPASGPRSLINIAEDTEDPNSHSAIQRQASVELPTLNEEDTCTAVDTGTDSGPANSAASSQNTAPPIAERIHSPGFIPTKKISNLSLNETNQSPFSPQSTGPPDQSLSPLFSTAANNNNGHSISRSSSMASRHSATTPIGGLNSSGSSLASAVRSKVKKTLHRHHECSGKPLVCNR
ncbi:HFL272Cp [Eremothecium sinecaudum]|uniref:HFL272Cp n=1 Tax=Eremothecium sinecaudum TaxID=45286 RepID=A0A0X8HU81_9SACH|nr:HFL272Cp [Eremothecium sinecaudum]AMD21584.1 HFL272Cp [Eremothecium sinecaudum]